MRQTAKMAMGLMVLGLVMATQLEAGEEARKQRRIVVSIPDRKLAVVEGDQVIKIYPVAVGAPKTPSPVGEFTIIARVDQPAYYKHGKVLPAGKSNPVGTRWIGLSLKGYGIHGTNDPASIGKARSHGCIRLQNRDVEDLFNQVAVGDIVELHGEYSERVAQLFGAKPSPSSPNVQLASLVSRPASGSQQKTTGL